MFGIIRIACLIGLFLPVQAELTPAVAPSLPDQAQVQVWFSPDGGATDAIVTAIHDARKEILMQAYSFTSAPIARALVEAHTRGVTIVAILDKSQRTEHYSGATFLKNAGIPVFIDVQPAIAHSKILIIDRQRIFTGSFNFTTSAEKRNTENLLLLTCPNSYTMRSYLENFISRQRVSVPF